MFKSFFVKTLWQQVRLLVGIILLFSMPLQASSKLRIGTYSGTFDPPHQGHIDLIERAIRELHLDFVIVFVGIEQLHKPNASPFVIRDQMARAAFSKIPQVRFLTEEQALALREGGVPSFQEKLSADYIHDTVFQIMGDDSWLRLYDNPLAKFPSNFVVAISSRDSNLVLPKPRQAGLSVVQISPDYRDYSSTRFRRSMANGEMPSQIPLSVQQIIRKYGLYQKTLFLKCVDLF